MAGSLGSFFTSSLFPVVASGTTAGLGEIGNLLAGRQASNEEKAILADQNAITSLTPAQLSAKVNSAAQPISTAQMQQISNLVQGDVASRGLAQAPGVFAAEESQDLAPLVQANYNTALQQVLAQLGLPLQYADTLAQFLPKQQNMTPAMMLFLQSLSKYKGGGATPNANFPTTGPNLSQLSPPPDNGGVYGDTPTPDPFAGLSDLLTQGASA